MTPVKEFGECLISVGDKDYFFRPSFLAISSIGDPVEIVQTFYDLYNDEAAKLIKKAAEYDAEQRGQCASPGWS